MKTISLVHAECYGCKNKAKSQKIVYGSHMEWLRWLPLSDERGEPGGLGGAGLVGGFHEDQQEDITV